MRKLGGRLAAGVFALLIALAATSPLAAEGNPHRVSLGDTLWGIARLYGVTVDAIAQLNGIANPDRIFMGQLLDIPGGSDSATEAPAPGGVYEVQPGDTLSAIAVRLNISMQALQDANQLADPDLIVAGQRLTIPSSQPAAVPIVPTPWQRPVSPEIEALIEELAAAEGVDANVVKALAWVESGWQQGAVSPAGAVGIMQIMPQTAAWLEDEVFGYPLNEDTSAYDNIKAGARLLHILLQSTSDLDMALASYYQGYGATSSGILYKDTAGYVAAVRAVKAAFWP